MENVKFSAAQINLLSTSRKVSNEIDPFPLYHLLLGISNYLQKLNFLGFLVFEKVERSKFKSA